MKLGRMRIMLPQSWHVKFMKTKKNGSSRTARVGKAGYVVLYGLLAISVIWVVLTLVGSHLRPIIGTMATARVNYLASAAIHDAIAKRLEMGNYSYDQIVQFEKDLDGRITALKTDMLVVNRMKADITRDVLDAVKNVKTSELGIPLGNLIGGELFGGRGPLIPVKIVPVGTAGAEFSNVFVAAGINQTRHQILLTIHADLSVLLPGDTVATTVLVQFNVAETVIIGSVPETYASFDSGLPSAVSP